MTNAEAKAILKSNKPTSDPRECGKELCTAVDIAIEALEKQNKLVEAIHRIEALNPMDYGCMGNYKAHKGARMMKKDVLDILNDLIEEEEQEDKCED